MKKAVLFAMSLAMSVTVMVESAFAQSTLETKAESLLGTKYSYGGTTTQGFDCSGFTMYVLKHFGISLAHSSKAQASTGTAVAKKNLRAGDLVFFDTGGSGISHVGLYLGDQVFIHAASKGVMKNRLTDTYYATRYVTARRILSDSQYKKIAAE